MKSQTKTKKITKKVSRRRKISPSIVLAHANRPGLRHFRLVNLKHTGKLIHHRHTSHLALLLILVFVGFFLYISENIVNAEIKTGTVTIGLVVPGPAPTVGAEITEPINDKTFTDKTTIDISGTCASDSFVVVKSNGSVIGSTNCSVDNKFSITAQLSYGDNILTALNYDNINQVGPQTTSILIHLTKSNEPVVVPTEPTKNPETPSVTPVIPENPSIIPGDDSVVQSCNSYKVGVLPSSSVPQIAVACVPRIFLPNVDQYIGILVWGGSPPYAISINWGSGGEDTLMSIPTAGYHLIKFSYAVSNNYRIAFKLKDKSDNLAIVETAVKVSGQISNSNNGNNSDNTNSSLTYFVNWFIKPVPMYIVAVSITLGFWGGDLFDRYFGAHKKRSRTKKTI